MSKQRFDADESLLFKIIRLVNLLSRPFEERLGRQHEITLTEWRVLLVASNHPGAAASEIAELTGFDKMTVSRALARLERAGRVLRAADRSDARRSVISLTARGRALVAAIGADATVRERQLFAALSVAERRVLAEHVGRLTEQVKAMDASGERRM